MSCEGCPDTDLRQHGADPLFGPPCCKDITPECGGYPADNRCSDHSCCPDPCQHTVWNRVNCPAPCCHHLPKSLCVMFTPDTPTDECFATGYKLDASHTDIGTDYSGSLPGVGNIIVSAEQIPYFNCVWRLHSPDDPDFEEIVPIDHWGDANCRQPPVFTIEGVSYPVRCDTCTGKYEIFPYDGDVKIPFQSRFDCTTQQTVEVDCGYCGEVSTILCVRRPDSAPDDLRDPYSRQEFSWDPESVDPQWIASNGDTIELIEYEGECYLEPHIGGLEWLEDEAIILDPETCTRRLHLHVERYGTDDWIEITAAPCSMFKFICGNCRCICRDVCMVGMDGTEPIDRTTLTWNGGGWSEEGEYGASISLEADENGNCQVRFRDWEPVAISNTCGNDLVFFLSDPEETNNWRIVYCKECAPCDAGGGDCRSICPDIPMTLFADFEFVEWEVAVCGPAEGPPPTEPPCIEPFTVPMFLVRASPEASIDWFWFGQVTVPCRSCNGAVSEPADTLIQITLDCSGFLTVGGNQWSVTIPCGCEGGEWDIEVLTDALTTAIGLNCCVNAVVRITITE